VASGSLDIAASMRRIVSPARWRTARAAATRAARLARYRAASAASRGRTARSASLPAHSHLR
jgi:hypothetical protein